MSFQDCNDNKPDSNFLTLKEDMEEVLLKFLDEPVPHRSEYNGKKSVRYAAPVLTLEGLKIYPFGLKVLQIIEKRWGTFQSGTVKVTRFGSTNDPKTQYELVLVPDDENLEKLAAKVEGLHIVNLMSTLPNVLAGKAKPGEEIDDIPM